jgi:dTDP-4-dehydrorhamnose reductase
MLGRAIAAELDRDGTRYDAPTRAVLDLAKPGTIASGIARGTELVVCAAAYTNVDGAESDEASARAVNADGLGELARRCHEIGALLLSFSTDYVFDGAARAPYPVDAAVAPLGAYGRTKALGEAVVREAGARHLTIRTSWLHAPWGKCFPRTIATLAAERDSIRVVDDQRGRPTFAPNLARAALDLVARGAEGTFHVTDGGDCTWYDVAVEVVRATGAHSRIERCTTAEFPRPAARPAWSVLDLAATERLLGPMPDWRLGVRASVAAP